MRVVIAEDSVLLREGIARLLLDAGCEIVARVGDGPGLIAAVERQRPDVSIVDVRMPPGFRDEGLRAAIEARRRVPGSPVLVLSQYVEERYAGELLESGAQGIGYLLKDRVADVGEFVAAVRQVAAGGTVLDPEVVTQLFARRRRGDRLDELTPRERETLALMAEGRSNSAIASHLSVSDGAVEKHVTNIFGKLNLEPTDADHRRVLAVLAYLRGNKASGSSIDIVMVADVMQSDFTLGDARNSARYDADTRGEPRVASQITAQCMQAQTRLVRINSEIAERVGQAAAQIWMLAAELGNLSFEVARRVDYPVHSFQTEFTNELLDIRVAFHSSGGYVSFRLTYPCEHCLLVIFDERAVVFFGHHNVARLIVLDDMHRPFAQLLVYRADATSLDLACRNSPHRVPP